MTTIELDFGAISIDNSTLKREGYKFSEGLLAQLNQFKESPVQVVQTDIVHNEAIKHIRVEIEKSRSLIEKALRSGSKHLKINSETITKARELLSIEGNESEIAEMRLNDFYEFIGAVKIDSGDYADLSNLIDLYFSTKAPFEKGNDKKNEFPDAIALHTLEGWANCNDTNIIAVSQDKGWDNYSQTSDRITVFSSLAEALEKFQPHNMVVNVVRQIREGFLNKDSNQLFKDIEQAIINSIDGYDIWIEADSYLYFEWDDTSATYCSHELDYDKSGLVRVLVVSINDNSITLEVGATVVVEVEANFSFAAKDSVDKDYIDLGSNYFNRTESYYTNILITLEGDFSKSFDDIGVTKIDVLETIKHSDFGEVEPDWRNESEN